MELKKEGYLQLLVCGPDTTRLCFVSDNNAIQAETVEELIEELGVDPTQLNGKRVHLTLTVD